MPDELDEITTALDDWEPEEKKKGLGWTEILFIFWVCMVGGWTVSALSDDTPQPAYTTIPEKTETFYRVTCKFEDGTQRVWDHAYFYVRTFDLWIMTDRLDDGGRKHVNKHDIIFHHTPSETATCSKELVTEIVEN